MSSNNRMRVAVAGALTASVLGSGLALAPSADAAVSSTTSTKAYEFAKTQINKPYLLGAEGFKKYDCSGLAWRSYQQAGKSWTRKNAHEQRRTQTVDITSKQARKGDLIFFKLKNSDGIYDHVGVYAGSGYMIDAQTSDYYGRKVIKEKISGYWSRNYVVDYRRVK